MSDMTASAPPSLRERIGHFVEGPMVQRAIMALIILNGITLGLETTGWATGTAQTLLVAFDRVVVAIFVAEIVAKLIYRRLGFFRNGWNVFDFIIVGIALIPATGPLAVMRALRILRVLRLISVVPQMRRVVTALVTAIPGLFSVCAIIGLCFYVGAVLATKLFGASFPDWFGSIGASMYTLFQVMTLESWSMGIVRPVMEIYPLAWMFFVPFIIMMSFAILNLFIGIIVDAMSTVAAEDRQEAMAEAAEAAAAEAAIIRAENVALHAEEHQDLAAIRADLAEVKAALAHLLARQGGPAA